MVREGHCRRAVVEGIAGELGANWVVPDGAEGATVGAGGREA